MENLFDQLKSEYQEKLLIDSEQYVSALWHINTLKNKFSWNELTVSELRSFCLWGGVDMLDCSINDLLLGIKFLK